MSEVRGLVRKSLPLTAADLQDLAFIRQTAEQRQVLSEMSGTEVTEGTSEASYLRAVLEVGIQTLREHAEDRGYAAVAADQATTLAQRRRAARRRTPAWANE